MSGVDLRRLRGLAEAADGGWGPDGWYAEHELRYGLRGTSTDLEADVAYLLAASPDVVIGLIDALMEAESKVSTMRRFVPYLRKRRWVRGDNESAVDMLRCALGGDT